MSFPKALLVSVGALALATTTASAAIVCNEEGECWHVKGKVEYKPEFKLHVYPDEWKWGEKEHFKWREPAGEGHGYWKGGVWIKL